MGYLAGTQQHRGYPAIAPDAATRRLAYPDDSQLTAGLVADQDGVHQAVTERPARTLVRM